jgi:hypothetical protein
MSQVQTFYLLPSAFRLAVGQPIVGDYTFKPNARWRIPHAQPLAAHPSATIIYNYHRFDDVRATHFKTAFYGRMFQRL